MFSRLASVSSKPMICTSSGTRIPCPDKLGSRCTECRQCKEKHGFPAGVQKVCKSVQSPRKWKIHEKSYDSSWDFGALEGTQIPGPLIKSAGRGFISKDGSFELSLFFASQRDFLPGNFCTLCRILQRKAPSARSETVQKPCRNRALTLGQIKNDNF